MPTFQKVADEARCNLCASLQFDSRVDDKYREFHATIPALTASQQQGCLGCGIVADGARHFVQTEFSCGEADVTLTWFWPNEKKALTVLVSQTSTFPALKIGALNIYKDKGGFFVYTYNDLAIYYINLTEYRT
jgi:hypothetical protein